MRWGVVVFPGSNDDARALWVAERILGDEAVALWHKDRDLRGADVVLLPGGFSYGDYLRCGAIARFSPATAAVTEFAAAGGLVLGICNGFQILCEAGLLPGVLRLNTSLIFVCRDVRVRAASAETRFTSRCEHDQELVMPVKHGAGCWFADEGLYEQLLARNQIAFRYAEPVNGSLHDVAGVINENGNVMGLMPHPEHAVDPLLGSADGAFILASLVDAAREHALAAV